MTARMSNQTSSVRSCLRNFCMVPFPVGRRAAGPGRLLYARGGAGRSPGTRVRAAPPPPPEAGMKAPSAAILLVAAVLLGACGGGGDAARIVVATEAAYPPMESKAPDGAIVGF